jgi:hypothetical protein
MKLCIQCSYQEIPSLVGGNLEGCIDFVAANTSVVAYEKPFVAGCRTGQLKVERTIHCLPTSIDLYSCGGWSRTLFNFQIFHIAAFKYN